MKNNNRYPIDFMPLAKNQGLFFDTITLNYIYPHKKNNMSDNRFEEPSPLNDVADFHRTFNMPVLETPTIPSAERCALRVVLLQEELDELKEAIAENDMTAIADALSDIQYVLSGAILEFGLASKFKALFEEVQRSNMSKVCPDYETAEATLESLRNFNHIVAGTNLPKLSQEEIERLIHSPTLELLELQS